MTIFQIFSIIYIIILIALLLIIVWLARKIKFYDMEHESNHKLISDFILFIISKNITVEWINFYRDINNPAAVDKNIKVAEKSENKNKSENDKEVIH